MFKSGIHRLPIVPEEAGAETPVVTTGQFSLCRCGTVVASSGTMISKKWNAWWLHMGGTVGHSGCKLWHRSGARRQHRVEEGGTAVESCGTVVAQKWNARWLHRGETGWHSGCKIWHSGSTEVKRKVAAQGWDRWAQWL